MIPIILRALGIISKNLKKILGGTGDSLVNSQNTKMSPGDVKTRKVK